MLLLELTQIGQSNRFLAKGGRESKVYVPCGPPIVGDDNIDLDPTSITIIAEHWGRAGAVGYVMGEVAKLSGDVNARAIQFYRDL